MNWCDTDCRMKDHPVGMTIDIGVCYILVACLVCSELKKKNMSEEFKIKDAIDSLSM